MMSGRALNLLRPLLHVSFERACTTCQTEGGDPTDLFKENLHLTVPSEKRGAQSLQAERVCTARPPEDEVDLANLLASHWRYLGQKRVQLVNIGYAPLTEGLHDKGPAMRAQDFRRPAYIFSSQGGVAPAITESLAPGRLQKPDGHFDLQGAP